MRISDWSSDVCSADLIFGPCCHIRPFGSEEEAIAVANATDYGLSAAIFTQDLSRAHRVAAEVDVGITWVNSWFLRDLRTPFGGTGHSGIGREGGVHSLEFYTELRSEEHTSELQSLMRISYAVFCLKKKKSTNHYN